MALLPTKGSQDSHAWLRSRKLSTLEPHWYVEVTIPTDSDSTRLEINIYPEEWGFVFRAGTRVSSIRVTDEPFVSGSDHYGLLRQPIELETISDLLDVLEQVHGIAFYRMRASVRSNIARAIGVVRPWLLGAGRH